MLLRTVLLIVELLDKDALVIFLIVPFKFCCDWLTAEPCYFYFMLKGIDVFALKMLPLKF